MYSFSAKSTVFILVSLLLLLPSCGSDYDMVNGILYEKGIASWYGEGYEGLTATGVDYDPDLFTAAHKELPFGSVVRVVNTENGTTVTVRINDRGPFVEGRVIDLSRAAAEKIDIIEVGLADVELYLLDEG